jgi:hypothetical protein
LDVVPVNATDLASEALCALSPVDGIKRTAWWFLVRYDEADLVIREHFVVPTYAELDSVRQAAENPTVVSYFKRSSVILRRPAPHAGDEQLSGVKELVYEGAATDHPSLQPHALNVLLGMLVLSAAYVPLGPKGYKSWLAVQSLERWAKTS